jgi:hypothetical protein
MCALYEYDIMSSTGKLRFARGTHENLIYLPRPLAGKQEIINYDSASKNWTELANGRRLG